MTLVSSALILMYFLLFIPALTVRIKTRKFIHNYAPNIDMALRFEMPVDGEAATFEIRDTAALQVRKLYDRERSIDGHPARTITLVLNRFYIHTCTYTSGKGVSVMTL